MGCIDSYELRGETKLRNVSVGQIDVDEKSAIKQSEIALKCKESVMAFVEYLKETGAIDFSRYESAKLHYNALNSQGKNDFEKSCKGEFWDDVRDCLEVIAEAEKEGAKLIVCLNGRGIKNIVLTIKNSGINVSVAKDGEVRYLYDPALKPVVIDDLDVSHEYEKLFEECSKEQSRLFAFLDVLDRSMCRFAFFHSRKHKGFKNKSFVPSRNFIDYKTYKPAKNRNGKRQSRNF